jgi:hypothetical protein
MLEVSEYLADLVFKPAEEIYKQLEIMNHLLDVFDELYLDENQDIQIHNKQIGIRTHIPNNIDYSTKAAMLGHALYGIHWSIALPDYLKIVNQKWKKISKKPIDKKK